MSKKVYDRQFKMAAVQLVLEENLSIKNAPPIVRLCLTMEVHFIRVKTHQEYKQLSLSLKAREV
ncbi:hypothetical protein CN345_27210 [Bacillus thuringiensis]|uniref:hypothetical protein n=1 Tax=Bacillus thuringiensis TaxID=1428 RepID=UPI000BF439AA|nr:hypothetical protein [Bacillus thuringiensis]PES11613.1 hypothetical protein CN488_29330 [Bacillus anthracis]PEZ26082.1 hypothetical protein CN345_27210 [Bacillus thuringiensis]PGY62187.1 hypothetical protein COE09_05605 [Bacillus thuringiensis]